MGAYVSPSARFSSPIQTKLDAKKSSDFRDNVGKAVIATVLSVGLFLGPAPALADGQTKEFRLPPIDQNDKTRCTLNSSKMGQANAARDKLYDLRQCELSGEDASGFDLSGAIMTKTNLSNAKFFESQFSKGYLRD